MQDPFKLVSKTKIDVYMKLPFHDVLGYKLEHIESALTDGQFKFAICKSNVSIRNSIKSRNQYL